jgi:hypothetical protein
MENAIGKIQAELNYKVGIFGICKEENKFVGQLK